MNTGWSQIPSALQTQFLQATGLTSLPEVATITGSQWETLRGIVGEECSTELMETAENGGSIANPTLPASTFSLSGDLSDLMLIIAELRAKLGELQLESSTVGIQSDRDNLDSINKAEQARVQEMLESMDDSRKTGTMKKVFGWIGAVAGIAGAAVLTVLTLGMALPALAVAVTMTVGMGIEQAGKMDDVLEFMVMHTPILSGKIESGEVSLEEAKQYLYMGVTIGLMVVKIATELFAGLTVAGVSLAVGVAGLATVAGSSAGAVLCGVALAIAAATIAGAGASLAGGIAQVGTGVSSMIQASQTKEIAEFQAESSENKAWIAQVQTTLAELMGRFEELLQKMHEGISGAGEMLSAGADTQHAIMTNMNS